MSTIDAEAERVYDRLGRGEQTDVKTIRAALLSAEKRGKEEERERCAKIADAHSECERDCGDVIAAAIRGS